MRSPLPLYAALTTLLSATALRAQTADQARLMFTVGLGQSSGGGTLWKIGRQPFLTKAATDTLALSRSFRRSLDVVLSGTYFPGDHLGFNVEAQLLGLATEDDCRIVETQGSRDTQDLCRTIGRAQHGGASAALSGGLVYRIASRQPLHPYGRINAGLLITQESFVKTSGTVVASTGEPAQLTLYEDRNPSTVQPYLSFGGGVVAVIGKGYQLRFELRDNWVRVPKVDRATDIQGVKPPTSTVGKHLLTATLGFDVVLERKRGRRY